MGFIKTSWSARDGVQRHLETAVLTSGDYGDSLGVVTWLGICVSILYTIFSRADALKDRVCTRPRLFKLAPGNPYSPA